MQRGLIKDVLSRKAAMPNFDAQITESLKRKGRYVCFWRRVLKLELKR